VKQFNAPNKWLGGLDAEATSWLVLGTADIALVIDAGGTIRDLAFGSDELTEEDYGEWLDKQWSDTVTADSRSKVAELLSEAAPNQTTRWRHVNHPSSGGADLPVRYSALRLPTEGAVVAVGRDLSTVAALQQRLVSAQQSIERDYSKFRHIETRYRLLFNTASEGFLIVDAASRKVMEANAAAQNLLGGASRRIVGQPFLDLFDADSANAVNDLLAGAESKGKTLSPTRAVTGGKREAFASASLFRQEDQTLLLIRLSPPGESGDRGLQSELTSNLFDILARLPDGFVTTDRDGRILTANRAFLDLVELAVEEQTQGQSLDRWLGRAGVDMNVLLSSLLEEGSVRLFSTTLRGEHGTTTEVEIAAVAVENEGGTRLGFSIRNIGRRMTADAARVLPFPSSSEQLSELVGRVPLKELVRETTDIIERLFIESALRVTDGNRAYAAQMLGLSRQTLYAKLHRHDLGDPQQKSEH